MKKAKIIGIILIILSIAFGGYLYIKKQYKSDGMNMSGYVLGSGLSPDLTEEEIKAMLQKKVDESKVAFIIRTEKIAPDQYIKDIELIGNKLKKGKHNAVAYVKAYNKKTDELVGDVQVDMVITSK